MATLTDANLAVALLACSQMIVGGLLGLAWLNRSGSSGA